MTDEQLMDQVLAKQRPALEELYHRYGKLVYSFALKSTKNTQDAKEVVQAVFTRLWTTERGYDPARGKFVNWMITITRNLTIDYLRKERKHEQSLTLEQETAAFVDEDIRSNPELEVDRTMVREQIREAYQYLSVQQAELLELLYWKGYTLSEIAQLNQEPIGTVKSRLHQTLKILRKKLVVVREEERCR